MLKTRQWEFQVWIDVDDITFHHFIFFKYENIGHTFSEHNAINFDYKLNISFKIIFL